MSTQLQPLVMNLWPDTPHAQTDMPPEVEFLNPNVLNLRFLRNISVPTLTAFLPDRSINTGTAMIVCPGGGLHVLAIDYEGYDVARWFCEHGVAAFVLKYRLIPTAADHDEFMAYFSTMLQDMPHMVELTRQHTPTILADGQQAVNIVRQRANEWGIRPNRIGMMGFSAGAFVTVTTTLQAERQNRPDFAASIYGALWEKLELATTLPPLFIMLTDDDALTVEPSLQLYSAWHKANTSVEMHIYAHGGHGFAMGHKNVATDSWIELLYEWMQVLELVNT